MSLSCCSARLLCLQTRVVQAMAQGGEAGLAADYAAMLQLPATALQVDPAVLIEEARRRAETFLQLPIPRKSAHRMSLLMLHWMLLYKVLLEFQYRSAWPCRAEEGVLRQISDADVHFVEREGEILPAMANISGSFVLGVDAEWEPSFQTSSGSGMTSSHVSILQVRLLPCMAKWQEPGYCHMQCHEYAPPAAHA